MDVVLVWFFWGFFLGLFMVTYGLFGIAYELFCGLLTSYLWLVWNCLRSPLQVTLRFVWNLIGITYEVPCKVTCSLLTSNFKFAWDYLRSPLQVTLSLLGINYEDPCKLPGGAGRAPPSVTLQFVCKVT